MGNAELFYDFNQRLAEVSALFRRKQADYGPCNIAMAGERGVVVRLNDKIQRLSWLLNGSAEPANESIRDSWLDIADYGIIGLLLHDAKWPGGGDERRGTCGTCGQTLQTVSSPAKAPEPDPGNDRA